MLNGFYTIARGMINLERSRDLTANNLANSDTPGYKKELAVYQAFPEILMNRLEGDEKTPIGSKGSGSKLAETYVDFRSGGLKPTDNPLDFALDGEGFFAVEAPGGVRYTRSGHFTLNESGQLVTENGYPLLGQLGPILTGGRPLQVDETGQILIDGRAVDNLRVVSFEDLQQLEKEGDNLYRAPEDLIEVPVNTAVRQGFLEQSNVNVIKNMTQLITATRMYEISQKALQSQDETLSKAVNEVGRANG